MSANLSHFLETQHPSSIFTSLPGSALRWPSWNFLRPFMVLCSQRYCLLNKPHCSEAVTNKPFAWRVVSASLEPPPYLKTQQNRQGKYEWIYKNDLFRWGIVTVSIGPASEGGREIQIKRKWNGETIWWYKSTRQKSWEKEPIIGKPMEIKSTLENRKKI